MRARPEVGHEGARGWGVRSRQADHTGGEAVTHGKQSGPLADYLLPPIGAGLTCRYPARVASSISLTTNW